MIFRHKLFSLFALLGVVGIIAGIVGFSNGYVSTADDNNASRLSPDVKVTYLHRVFFKNGDELKTTRKVLRLQRGDGSWRETVSEFNADGSLRGSYV